MRRRMSRRAFVALSVLAPVVLFLVLAIAWQVVAETLPSVIPPLQRVSGDFFMRPLFYLDNAGHTLLAAIVGFAIGTVLSVGISILMVYFLPVRAAVLPLALLLNVTPIVAIAPALQAAFGFTPVPNIVVAALATVFPTMVNALAGFRAVDPQALEVLTVMSASRWDALVQLRFPTALPYLFAGAKLAVAAAMIGSVVSEFIGATKGLGAAISQSVFYLNLGQLWSSIFISALLSLALVGLVALAERLTIRW